MAFETLYKTDRPQDLERAEYYQARLEMEVVDGEWMYFVREKHGWYDDAKKKPFHHTSTLNPEEGFSHYAEAQERYQQQITHRAREGFVHCFSLDPFTGVVYRRIESHGDR